MLLKKYCCLSNAAVYLLHQNSLLAFDIQLFSPHLHSIRKLIIHILTYMVLSAVCWSLLSIFASDVFVFYTSKHVGHVYLHGDMPEASLWSQLLGMPSSAPRTTRQNSQVNACIVTSKCDQCAKSNNGDKR